MTDTTILTERRGHILIVTINRPEARNAVNAAVHVGDLQLGFVDGGFECHGGSGEQTSSLLEQALKARPCARLGPLS